LFPPCAPQNLRRSVFDIVNADDDEAAAESSRVADASPAAPLPAAAATAAAPDSPDLQRLANIEATCSELREELRLMRTAQHEAPPPPTPPPPPPPAAEPPAAAAAVAAAAARDAVRDEQHQQLSAQLGAVVREMELLRAQYTQAQAQAQAQGRDVARGNPSSSDIPAAAAAVAAPLSSSSSSAGVQTDRAASEKALQGMQAELRRIRDEIRRLDSADAPPQGRSGERRRGAREEGHGTHRDDRIDSSPVVGGGSGSSSHYFHSSSSSSGSGGPHNHNTSSTAGARDSNLPGSDESPARLAHVSHLERENTRLKALCASLRDEVSAAETAFQTERRKALELQHELRRRQDDAARWQETVDGLRFENQRLAREARMLRYAPHTITTLPPLLTLTLTSTCVQGRGGIRGVEVFTRYRGQYQRHRRGDGHAAAAGDAVGGLPGGPPGDRAPARAQRVSAARVAARAPGPRG